MKTIYIASPYTKGDVGENVSVQIQAIHKIIDIGGCPIAPLLMHYAHIYKQRPHQDWMEIDLCMISKSDILLRLPGESEGADIEVNRARQLGIPVYFSFDDLKEKMIKF